MKIKELCHAASNLTYVVLCINPSLKAMFFGTVNLSRTKLRNKIAEVIKPSKIAGNQKQGPRSF